MTAPKKEHEERIADARNSLAEVLNRARYLQEPTFLTNRGKRVAVVTSTDFYVQALRDRAIIDELHRRTQEPGVGDAYDEEQSRIIRGAIHAAALTVDST